MANLVQVRKRKVHVLIEVSKIDSKTEVFRKGKSNFLVEDESVFRQIGWTSV
jgi:hypothetical protein